MPVMHLSLIVLRSMDQARLAEFYDRLGIKMIQERHGKGPTHYAGNIDSGVIEIYPAKAHAKVTFGLGVKSIDDFVVKWLAAGGSSTEGGMLIDPDGNAIHLSSEN